MTKIRLLENIFRKSVTVPLQTATLLVKGPETPKGGIPMKDEQIIELFNIRDERAISETQAKYGEHCNRLAGTYLQSREDREECLNDALLALWNTIPPESPRSLFAYLSGIVRNLAKSRRRAALAQKRGGEVQIVGEEFLAILDDGSDLAAEFEASRAGKVINSFLERSTETERDLFVMRFYFNESYPRICKLTGFSEGKVKMTLSRMKGKLKDELRKEGFIV